MNIEEILNAEIHTLNTIVNKHATNPGWATDYRQAVQNLPWREQREHFIKAYNTAINMYPQNE